jgi:beta-lactamase class C
MTAARTFQMLVLAASLVVTGANGAVASSRQQIQATVDAAVGPVMKRDAIPGLSVGLIVHGKAYLFNYGLASIDPNLPVTDDTLFEIGSVSKTLTATLASLAQTDGHLRLSDPVSKNLPSLQGSPFGNVTLLNLGTHTPGGLPLQVPDDVRNNAQLIEYLKTWRPTYARGTYRTYSNVGIGLLGLVTSNSFGENFDALMERDIFRALGMNHTYINVPSSRIADYAEGYRQGTPIRMTPGMLWSEAYGVRTTASDLLRFVEANVNTIAVDPVLQKAITETHTGYFTAGPLTQDLIWEQYPYPVALKTLLEGNSYAMIFNPTPASALSPPERPRADVWINKTGSTNGFGTYVAFIPEEHCGIAILANESYPIPDRVALAYAILSSLCGTKGANQP